MDHPESPAPARWERLASRRLLERWWLTLREDRVRLPSGHVIDEYHVVEDPDWAGVLALTDSGHAVLIEQYRYGIDQVSLELPAGACDTGERPADTARRELLEETGYEATEWASLGRVSVEPGRHTNWAHLFLARGAQKVAAQAMEEGEDLALRLVPARSLISLIESGRIIHAAHVAAIYRAATEGLLG